MSFKLLRGYICPNQTCAAYVKDALRGLLQNLALSVASKVTGAYCVSYENMQRSYSICFYKNDSQYKMCSNILYQKKKKPLMKQRKQKKRIFSQKCQNIEEIFKN